MDPGDAALRRGLLAGLAAYLMWGVFPLYFRLLASAGAVEILAHRVFWSLVTVALLVTGIRRWSAVRALLRDRRRLGLLSLAAVLVAVNWVVYIWAVNHDRVLESSLGYFINPLVTVLLGVLVLRERLRAPQWVALALAAAAVVVITVDYGHPPWIAVTLALSFGAYGLVKKRADAPALPALVVETAVLTPLAVGYLVVLTALGQSSFTTEGVGHALLLASTGLATSLPLIAFGAAATRLPLVALGLLQYLTPTMQFLIGAVVLHEPLSTTRWIGFALVWLALVAFTVDQLARRATGRMERRRAAGDTGRGRTEPVTAGSADAPPDAR